MNFDKHFISYWSFSEKFWAFNGKHYNYNLFGNVYLVLLRSSIIVIIQFHSKIFLFQGAFQLWGARKGGNGFPEVWRVPRCRHSSQRSRRIVASLQNGWVSLGHLDVEIICCICYKTHRLFKTIELMLELHFVVSLIRHRTLNWEVAGSKPATVDIIFIMHHHSFES